MAEQHIHYRSDYKYQLAKDYAVQTTLQYATINGIKTEFITLTSSGLLTVKEGYAWDGCSGPTVDDCTNMRASLVHDALYQLMRVELLNPQLWRKIADRLFRRHCRQDGMPWWRAWYYYRGVRIGGRSSAAPGNKKEVIRAPC